MLYYYALGGKQLGPVEEGKLVAMGVTRNTLVWCDGMTEWQPAGSVAALQYLFDPGVQTPPPPGQPQQPQQAAYAQPQNYAPMPKTWQVEALVITLVSFLCCSNLISGVIGIVALVKSGSVSSAYRMGNYAAAQEASQEAGRLTKIAFWVAIGWVLLLMVLIGIFAASAGGILALADSTMPC